MVAFTLSLVVALNTNIKGLAVGLLVGGSVRSLYGSSKYDFWSIQAHMCLYLTMLMHV